MVYQVRCPSLIKENLSFGDFNAKGKGAQHVADYLGLELAKFPFPLTYSKSYGIFNEFDVCDDLVGKTTINYINDKREVEFVFIDNERINSFFWKVYKMLDVEFKFSIYMCAFFYILGAFFLLSTALVNVIYTVKFFVF